MSSEYHSPPSPAGGGGIKPLSESNSANNSSCSSTNSSNIETPLDMSVTSKPRTPPPPYREPLPGSQFASALARPSVITQAPKREIISNQENKVVVGTLINIIKIIIFVKIVELKITFSFFF